ncbi:cupin domain-containing protein [Mucilaginibacter sp. FT3.2]|uniref:cupin domain-containing protein n=1 Tax=Mucilaginibacter sp. FT3.2 TaxID=2723090 RepID=UPI00160A361E|nr:cupin domain-containing protein [Mucilaginibacter sp. FT3.2]MBB6232240.1 quercetin dioxygenase-like cupin family protein [Mucilaginibacter sp. FT3.2]
MENSKKPATLVGPQEGHGLAVVGDSYRIVISGKQTEGAYALIEMLVPPGGGPGPHAHAGFNESFYIIDGQIEVKTENGKYTAGKGSFVNIPTGGLVHCFKNTGDITAHMLCTVVPAGLDEFFEEIGVPAPYGTFLPPPPMDEETLVKLKALAEKHGQKLFPPHYLD